MPEDAALQESMPEDATPEESPSAPVPHQGAPLEEQDAKPHEPVVALALTELRQQRDALQAEISALEGRRALIQKEIQSTFTGQADGVARRMKGFQDYLVGALQDLAVAAEQVDLVPQQVLVQPSPLDAAAAVTAGRPTNAEATSAPPIPGAAELFSQDEALIRERLASFGGQPDFYADAWKLRRTLDAPGATCLDDWFLGQGAGAPSPARAVAASMPWWPQRRLPSWGSCTAIASKPWCWPANRNGLGNGAAGFKTAWASPAKTSAPPAGSCCLSGPMP